MLPSYLKKIIHYLFLLLVFIVPLVFFWRNEELFEFNKIVVTYAITIVIGVAWLGRMIAEKRLIFSRSKLDIPLLLFVVSQILATIFSIHPRTSWLGYYTRFHGGLLSTLTYVFLYYAFISNLNKKHLKSLLMALFSSALLVALYAIPEHFGYSPSCLLIAGEFSVGCWIQDVQSRIFGTFGQPNWLAAYTITLIPLGLALSATAGSESKKSKLSLMDKLLGKWSLLIVTWLLTVTLVFTRSRSGVVGLAAGLGLMSTGLGWWWWQELNSKRKLAPKLKKFWHSLALGLAGILVVILIFGTPFTPSVSELIATDHPLSQAETTSLNQEQPENPPAVVNRLELGGTDSGEIRKIVWQGGLDVWRRYPIFGSGVETFGYSYYRDRPAAHNLVSEWDFLYNKAHNEFINYLATTGLVGLGAYLLVLGWFAGGVGYSFKTDLKKVRTKFSSARFELAVVNLGLLSGIAAQSVSNFFGFSTVMVTILLFLYLAVWEIQTRDKDPNQTKKTTLSWLQYGGLIVVVVIGLNLLLTVVSWWRADVEYAQGKAYMSIGNYSVGTQKLLNASQLNPNEALFYDELGVAYARLAVALAQNNQASESAQFAQFAIDSSNSALALNQVHLNFYKSRARIFFLLAQINLEFLNEARSTLEQALERSPTEAKLRYNLGLVEQSLGNFETARKQLELAVELKPNYGSARQSLGEIYQLLDQPELAKEQYNYILEFLSPGNTMVQEKLDSLNFTEDSIEE